jgi:hypothetical protein
MRKQYAPAVADPFVKIDLAVGSLCREVRRLVVDAQHAGFLSVCDYESPGQQIVSPTARKVQAMHACEEQPKSRATSRHAGLRTRTGLQPWSEERQVSCASSNRANRVHVLALPVVILPL